MANTANKTQLGILVTHEAAELLQALRKAKEEEAGLPVSLNAYIEMLVRQEAKRQGIKSGTGKPRRSP